MAATLVRCPACGHRDPRAVARHVVFSIARLLLGLAIATPLVVLGIDAIGLLFFGALIVAYAIRIAAQDVALLGPTVGLHWSDIVPRA